MFMPTPHVFNIEKNLFTNVLECFTHRRWKQLETLQYQAWCGAVSLLTAEGAEVGEKST